jgi:scyllo-inositol 2-dehydrogenase (NADP+)
MDMSGKSNQFVRVGIAGLGRSGWSIHALTIEALPDKFQMVAACDLDRRRQEEAQERFHCRTYADFGDLARNDEVDLIVLAMPSHLRQEYAVMALQAGKHVMLEKPMATSLAEADRMVSVARETGRLLTIFHNYRYAADFVKVREVVNSGKLGRVVFIRIAWHGFYRRWDWQTLTEFGGGQLNNAGSHAVDLALQLLADMQPRVFCHAEATPLWSGDAEGHAKIVLQVKGGPMIDIELTCICAYPQERWLIMGTQGGLYGSAEKLRWKYLDPDRLPKRPLQREPILDRSYFGQEPLPWIEEVDDLATDPSLSNRLYYLDLYATLRAGMPLAVTPESVRPVVAILKECHRQAEI